VESVETTARKQREKINKYIVVNNVP
jgi:hypothetical protein